MAGAGCVGFGCVGRGRAGGRLCSVAAPTAKTTGTPAQAQQRARVCAQRRRALQSHHTGIHCPITAKRITKSFINITRTSDTSFFAFQVRLHHVGTPLAKNLARTCTNQAPGATAALILAFIGCHSAAHAYQQADTQAQQWRATGTHHGFVTTCQILRCRHVFYALKSLHIRS